MLVRNAFKTTIVRSIMMMLIKTCCNGNTCLFESIFQYSLRVAPYFRVGAQYDRGVNVKTERGALALNTL